MRSVKCSKSCVMLSVSGRVRGERYQMWSVKFSALVKCGVQSAKCRGWIPMIVPVLLLAVFCYSLLGGFEPTTKLLVKWGGLTEKLLANGDSIHPNTLLKQEGLLLAEASFHDIDETRTKVRHVQQCYQTRVCSTHSLKILLWEIPLFEHVASSCERRIPGTLQKTPTVSVKLADILL